MYGQARGRGRGRSRVSVSGLSPKAVNEEGKLLTELISGPPATYPDLDRLPSLPQIDDQTTKLLDRWHKLRHADRSGPYFIESLDKETTAEEDPFAVERYSASISNTKKRPPLTAVLTLTSSYFPDELSSKRQKAASSRNATTSAAMKVFWLDQLKSEKEIDRLDELAKKSEEERRDESDNDANDLAQEQGEDEYSGNDYEQGEYFDDDEEYEEFEDAGDDDGPVY